MRRAIGRIEVNWFTKLLLISEAKFGDDLKQTYDSNRAAENNGRVINRLNVKIKKYKK